MKCPLTPKEIKMELGSSCKQRNVRTKMKELSDAHKRRQDRWSPLPLSNDDNDNNHDEDEVIILPSPAKKTKASSYTNTTMHTYMDHCDQARADKISMLIMGFLTGCALPFLIVESTFFINLLRAMNAVYIDKFLSKADTFTKKWLPMLYDSVKLRMTTLWKSRRGSLRTVGIDGFKTEKGEKVFLFSESIGNLVSFKDIVAQDEWRANILEI